MNYRNPKYNENGTIDCEIEHPEYGWIPFTADPNDVEEHGRAIHAEVEADHNDPQNPTTITAWERPADITGEEALAKVRAVRDSKLASEVDPIASNSLRFNSMSAEAQAAWTTYRQALLDVPQNNPNPSYTYVANGEWAEQNVTWPVKPE